MIRDRRVIPFLGSGFSASLNLPDWDTLLSKIAEEVEDDIPFLKVKAFCNADPLQIAEYYFLKSDRSIGPIRHTISRTLDAAGNPVRRSGAHVELVNLGAPQIYTTNYDDLIETTFRILRQPVEVIALPKHVATARGAKTQVIKYHGDLRHEATLVLTESSYYARLDFESPMDLKFRSDLLGRSVLFMGYSFRDINIRIIWFNLMRMMKDIHPEDRPTSYIVRFSPNPVLQRLYEEVGIKSIILDPESAAKNSADRSRLLSDFMLSLSILSAESQPTGEGNRQFFSRALIENLSEELAKREKTRLAWFRRTPGAFTDYDRLISVASHRSIPADLRDDVSNLMEKIVEMGAGIAPAALETAFNYVDAFGSAKFATTAVARGLLRADTRKIITAVERRWDQIWASKMTNKGAERVLETLEQEVENNQRYEEADYDLAYAVDIAHRIISGQLVDSSETDIIKRATKLVSDAGKLYAEVKTYSPSDNGAPNPTVLLQAITADFDRRNAKRPTTEDEIPF